MKEPVKRLFFILTIVNIFETMRVETRRKWGGDI